MISEINIDTHLSCKEIQMILNDILVGAHYQCKTNDKVRDTLTIKMVRRVQNHLSRIETPTIETILDFTSTIWSKKDSTLFHMDPTSLISGRVSTNIMMIGMYIIENLIINRSDVQIEHEPKPTRSDFESCLRLYLNAFIRSFDQPSWNSDEETQNCVICGESGGMPSCPEKHFYMCTICIRDQVLDERQTMFDLRCPMYTIGCTREICFDLISRAIDPFTLLERKQQLYSDTFLDMINHRSCSSCGHLGRTCCKDSTLQTQIDNGLTLCPKCNVVTYKGQTSCIRTTCLHCRHEYCWICLHDWETHGVGFFSNCRRQKHHTYERYNDDVRLFYSFNPLSTFSTIELSHLPDVYSEIHDRFKYPLSPLPVNLPDMRRE